MPAFQVFRNYSVNSNFISLISFQQTGRHYPLCETVSCYARRLHPKNQKKMTQNIPEILLKIKEGIFDKLNFEFTNLVKQKEGNEYSAYCFDLNNRKVIFRNAKITPTKVGQFVTLWKRNKEGLTQPYEYSVDFDFIMINTEFENHTGQFIFPKSILLNQGIISNKLKQGKRGIRVYPSWDKPTNKQAEKTQKWQLEYFLEISQKKEIDWDLVKKLYLSQ